MRWLSFLLRRCPTCDRDRMPPNYWCFACQPETVELARRYLAQPWWKRLTRYEQ